MGQNISDYQKVITAEMITANRTEIIAKRVIDGLAKCEKLCPQFHISLQSGCDKTLKSMNRHYTADEYKALCDKLRSSFENASLTTDIMVGFNDETEHDFNESLDFVKSIAFEK